MPIAGYKHKTEKSIHGKKKYIYIYITTIKSGSVSK